MKLRRRRALTTSLTLASLALIACGSSGSDDAGDANVTTTSGGATSGGGGGGRATGSVGSSAPSTSTSTGTSTSTTASSGTGGASTTGGGTLCTSLGWCQILNTKLADVCPDPALYPTIQAGEGCAAVIDDWSGAMADESRNRLVLWGGGHGGYYGNEVYALDLGALKMIRLNDPSAVDPTFSSSCNVSDVYADGRPVSRHTYDGLTYVAHADKMYAYGGAQAPCGFGPGGTDTWTLDLATVDSTPLGQAAPWTLMEPAGGQPLGWPGAVTDYDPGSKRIFLDDIYNLWAYDYDGNSYALLNDFNVTGSAIDYHMTGRVDPKRELFVIAGGSAAAGGGLRVYDVGPASDHAQQDWTSQVTGCDGLLAAAYPGLAYDPKLDKMVGWAGGDTIYLLDLDAKSCTTVTYAGGPGPQNTNGTAGRFRYFASLDVFAVVNGWQEDAYTLRLTP